MNYDKNKSKIIIPISGSLFSVGLAISIFVYIFAFNWTKDNVTISCREQVKSNTNDILPLFRILPKPISLSPLPVIEVISSNEKIISDVLVYQSPINEDYLNELPFQVDIKEKERPPPPPPVPVTPCEIWKIVEQMPRFPGCEDLIGSNKEKYICANKKLLKYIHDQIKYPVIAKELNFEGTVVISFFIKKNGRITSPKIVREKGNGLSEEALRIVNKMANEKIWTPGRQRDRPVKVQYTIPIKFALP